LKRDPRNKSKHQNQDRLFFSQWNTMSSNKRLKFTQLNDNVEGGTGVSISTRDPVLPAISKPKISGQRLFAPTPTASDGDKQGRAGSLTSTAELPFSIGTKMISGVVREFEKPATVFRVKYELLKGYTAESLETMFSDLGIVFYEDPDPRVNARAAFRLPKGYKESLKRWINFPWHAVAFTFQQAQPRWIGGGNCLHKEMSLFRFMLENYCFRDYLKVVDELAKHNVSTALDVDVFMGRVLHSDKGPLKEIHVLPIIESRGKTLRGARVVDYDPVRFLFEFSRRNASQDTCSAAIVSKVMEQILGAQEFEIPGILAAFANEFPLAKMVCETPQLFYLLHDIVNKAGNWRGHAMPSAARVMFSDEKLIAAAVAAHSMPMIARLNTDAARKTLALSMRSPNWWHRNPAGCRRPPSPSDTVKQDTVMPRIANFVFVTPGVPAAWLDSVDIVFPKYEPPKPGKRFSLDKVKHNELVDHVRGFIEFRRNALAFLCTVRRLDALPQLVVSHTLSYIANRGEHDWTGIARDQLYKRFFSEWELFLPFPRGSLSVEK
jgi:hypothetical protein